MPDTDAGRRWLRGWATNASTFAKERLAGEEVRIVTDEAAGCRDGYGRLLVHVVDGEVFGEQLLEGGYARLYETEFQLYDRFAAAEAEAQAEKRGVWGFSNGLRGEQTQMIEPYDRNGYFFVHRLDHVRCD